MREALKLAYGWVCYRLVVAAPLDWLSNRLGLHFVAWAGYYAYRPTNVVEDPR